MIKVEVIEDFRYKDFDKIESLERGTSKNQKDYLFKSDTFVCTKEMSDYLLGDNPIKRAVVKVVEVIPEKKEAVKEETISEELERKVKEQEEKIAETLPKPKKRKSKK